MSETRTVYPVPTKASKARISIFAEDLARRLGFAPGDSVESLVTRLGGQIVYRNPAQLERGRAPESIRIRGPRNCSIYIPSTTSLERDRFTVAHELGHLFLHYPLVRKNDPDAIMVATRWVDDADKEQQRAEWEANWFAAAFLMPSEAFSKEYKRLRGDIDAIAARFGVSTQAADIRVKNLNLG
jgi:Zn-dependent peptidase ImmA (M78 family)